MRPDYDITIERGADGSPVAMYFTPNDRCRYYLAADPCKLCRGAGTYKGYTGKVNQCFCEAATAVQANTFLQSKRFLRMSRPMQIAYLVRFNAELWAHRNGYEPKTLKYLCGLCSAALVRALRREGYEPMVADGTVGAWHHSWVVLQGRIMDLTYTQFDLKASKVFTAPKGDKRFERATYHVGSDLNHWLRDIGGHIKSLTTFNKAA